MNILQFWVIDSIVKASTGSTAVRSSSPRNSDSQDREPLFNHPDNDDFAPPRDIEDRPLSSTSTATEGDFKTLVGTESDKAKLLVSGSSSPTTPPSAPVVVAHDYPPNNIGGVSQSSTRARHKFKRSPSSLLGAPISYSAPAVNTLDPTQNSPRQALFSRSLDGVDAVIGDVPEFDTWEKDDWEEQAGEGRSGRRFEHRMIISAR